MKFVPKLCALSAALLGASGLHADDIDVIATEVSFSATYGVDVIAADTTWTADNVYILTDRVYVPNGVTLTIEAGTQIYSSVETFAAADPQPNPATSDDEVGALIVARGGRLVANGNATAPIVFDALQTLEAQRGVDLPYDSDSVVGPMPTPQTSGLWGGIVVLGNAYTLVTDSAGENIGNKEIEGFVPESAVDNDSNGPDGRTDILEYGFDADFPRDDADDSGILRYISIRHGGYAFGDGNEINGLTLGGVGTGTTIEFIEVVANNDDGVEFFGGTVNTSNLVVAFAGDDSFDIDEGHNGTHQFWFAIQNPNDGDNLGEWDGIGGAEKDINEIASGLTASAPQIFNATLVGPGSAAVTPSSSSKDNGLFIDDGFNGALRNSIILDSSGFLASFSSDEKGPDLVFTHNTVGNYGEFDGSDPATVLSGAPGSFYFGGLVPVVLDDNTAPGTDPGFADYTRDSSNFLVTIDPNPVSVDTNVASGAPIAAAYRGAFDGTNNWADNWTWMAEQGFFGSVSPADTDSDGLTNDFESLIGTSPTVDEGIATNQAAIEAYITTQTTAAATAATATAEETFVNAGGIEASIDTTTNSPVIGFELEFNDNLGSVWTTEETFNVTLPEGKRFYRFEAQAPASN